MSTTHIELHANVLDAAEYMLPTRWLCRALHYLLGVEYLPTLTALVIYTAIMMIKRPDDLENRLIVSVPSKHQFRQSPFR